MSLLDRLRSSFSGDKAPGTQATEVIVLNASSNAKQPQGKTVVRIVEQSNYRSSKDIADWLDAMQQAESIEQPERVALYDLYDMLLLDNHLQSLLNRRISHVTSKPFVVVNKKTKQIDEEKTALLQGAWFRQLRVLFQETKFWGHTLVQIDGKDAAGMPMLRMVPRRHVVPERGGWRVHQWDITTIPYRDDAAVMQWLIELGGPRTYGLLQQLGALVLIKKNALQAWSEYAEIFGLPMRTGEIASNSQEDANRMAAQLKNMGKAAYAVLRNGEKVSFIESTKGDAFKVFLELLTFCDQQMSKLVLGETLTSDAGKSGTRAQGEVHQAVSNRVEEADEDEVANWCEEVLFPKLTLHGYGFEGFSFQWSKAKTVTAEELAQHQWLDKTFNIDPSVWSERYGIPFSEAKPQPEPPVPPVPDPDAEPEPDPKKVKTPKNMAAILMMHSQIAELYKDEHEH